MEIKMNMSRKRDLGGGMKQTYPAGWQGDIGDDDTAMEWVNDGSASSVGPGAVASFTNDERAALKAVAGEVLENAALSELTLADLSREQLVDLAVANGVESAGDMDDGELYGLLEQILADEQSEEERSADTSADDTDPIALKDLNYDELVDVATGLEIDNPRAMKKVALLKLLLQRQEAAETEQRASTTGEASDNS